MFRVGDLLNEIRQKVCVEYHMQVNLLCPTGIYICDGSDDEAQELTDKLVDRGMLVKLDKLDNCYLCRTDPADVARVESKTFIVTPDRYQAVPHVADGCKGILGQWMSPGEVDEQLKNRLPGSMKVIRLALRILLISTLLLNWSVHREPQK